MAGPGYSFVAYPGAAADFAYAGGYPGGMSHGHMDLPGSGGVPYPHFPPTMAFPAMAGYPPPPHVHGGAPPSPVFSQPSHGSQQQQQQTAPPSPDRAGYSTEVRVMRQLCTAMTKLQNTMKDLAERQEQILDRMSLLEQRVGRMDDGIETIIENTEAVMADSRAIRTRVEDGETHDACESRFTDLMNDLVGKLTSCIGEELREIKKVVDDTDRYTRYEPVQYGGAPNSLAMSRPAVHSGQERAKELGGAV